MEVILLERVINLGRVGDKVSVKPGYGRNFLIPRGKALYATPENIQAFEQQRTEYEKTQVNKLQHAKEKAEQLASMEVKLVLEADPSGKLYGSVGQKMLADAITQAGCETQKVEVKLPNGPIRQIGDYVINLQLHPEVSGTVALKITAVST